MRSTRRWGDGPGPRAAPVRRRAPGADPHQPRRSRAAGAGPRRAPPRRRGRRRRRLDGGRGPRRSLRARAGLHGPHPRRVARASTGGCSTSVAVPRSCCAGGRPGSTATPRSGRCPAAASTTARRRPWRPVARPTRSSASTLGAEAVLGMMDDYATRSGYVITPVVLWGGGRTELRPHAGEVLAAYRIGLHQLLREDSPRFIDIPESDRPVVQLPLGRDLIHAPTGGRARAVPLAGPRGSRRPRRRLRAARVRLEVGPRRADRLSGRSGRTRRRGRRPRGSSTTHHATSSTRCTTSWAMRSPRCTV